MSEGCSAGFGHLIAEGAPGAVVAMQNASFGVPEG
jgi:hypothetical protein